MQATAANYVGSESSLLSAVRTMRSEIDALHALSDALRHDPLGQNFADAVTAMDTRSGRVIVAGMGKSGLIGRKIASTMTSTGRPAVFLHPSEASHGDLGMIGREDVVLLISWSGETTELSDIIAYSRRFGVKLIVMTANPDSTAGRAADICLTLPYVREACPNELAPTSSTTVQMVLGDALAIALIERRGFSRSDFLTFHPGGRLGAQLMPVSQLMGVGEDMPVVRIDATLVEATIEMSRKRYGCTAVVDDEGMLVGAFTDGDLRRSFTGTHFGSDVREHMTPTPIRISPNTLTPDALRILNEKAVSVLFVCEGDKLVGVVHVHDILRAGVA